DRCRLKRCATAAYDLHLFRDGRLVGTYPVTNLPRRSDAATEIEAWREASEIKMSDNQACRQSAPACAIVSFDVQLPKGKDVARIEFSAYAFNEDRVKSATDVWKWNSSELNLLPKAESVAPRAYIVSVGVNASQSGDWNLELAVSD